MRTLSEAHAALAVKREMHVRREEYLDHMTFQANRRPLFTELFGPLVGLKEEWAAQGASPAELDLSAFRYRQPMDGLVPVSTGWVGGEPERILEEGPGYVLARDHMGRTAKLCLGAATLALPMDYPVRTMDDWLTVKPHYTFTEQRLAGDWERVAREHRAAGRVVTAGIPGGFDEPRQLMGDAAVCVACCDQPELLHDIVDTLADTACRVLDRVSAAVPIDQLAVHEDMAGHSGPLLGPRHVREFILPYYRRVWDMLRERGARVFKQDSDGDMRPLIPAFLEAGVNVMYPMEPAAGMDIVRLREEYGTRLAFEGGIDKHVLRRTPEEIDPELVAKIPPMVRTGGCVLGLDHRIPNGTPLANYRHYIRRAWDLMGEEA